MNQVKPTTLRLLTVLFRQDTRLDSVRFELPMAALPAIWPQMTAAGRRSQISFLVRRGWLTKKTLAGQNWLTGSTYSDQLVRQSLAAFNGFTRPERWLLVVCLRSPEFDPQFKRLGAFLLGLSGCRISRGIYLVPDWYKHQIQDRIGLKYRSSVVIFDSGEWLVGDQSQLLSQWYAVADRVSIYSGISSEISSLLDDSQVSMSWSDQQKSHFVSVFDRWWELVSREDGLGPHLDSRVPNLVHLLSSLQQLLLHYVAS